MADDLTKPLGLAPPQGRRGRLRLAMLAGAGAAVVAVVAGAAWFLRPEPPGPTATAVINAPAAPPAADRTGSTTPAESGLSEVKPTGNLTEVGRVVIHNPSDPTVIALAANPIATLAEDSRYGPLPRIAADGTRPLDAYARPVDGGTREPRVAIVIGGVGIDPDGSSQAIELPGTITLALAPFGGDLARTMADARATGHELLLQIPLEPFNYPRTDPGPQTLTVDAPVSENIDRLHWLMGRTSNYVGVVNYMGGRFTGEAEALSPVIAEIGRRGLIYLDDGSSARSLAMDVAGATPVLRADVVLDADLSPAAIDERLDQLRAIARERGYAIATATAFPVTIDRVAAFARSAGERGLAIVPLSALAPSRRS